MGESLDLTVHSDHGYTTPATHPRGGAAAHWAPEVAAANPRVRGVIDYDKQVCTSGPLGLSKLAGHCACVAV
jgi:hypothetical protein